MVEEGDLDDKLEDKATNEVVDDVKKVAMEGVDKERKQVAMKVANTNCLDDLIDDALLLLFLLLDCRICIKRRCNSQTCCHLPHRVTSLTHSRYWRIKWYGGKGRFDTPGKYFAAHRPQGQHPLQVVLPLHPVHRALESGG